jgi:hypothetical protein
MAEVYLNPESDVNWATHSGADATPQADGDTRESVRAAGTLLKQLKASDTQTSKSKVLRLWAAWVFAHEHARTWLARGRH